MKTPASRRPRPVPCSAAARLAVLAATGVLGLGLLAGGAGLAAVWPSAETRISRSANVSLTSRAGRAAAHLPGGGLYAAWFQRTGAKSSIVLGLERTPGGSWNGDPVTISLGDSISSNPNVAVGPAGDIHVVWEDNRDGNEEIYYRHRDGAGDWGPEQRLTVGAEPSEWPVLAVSATGRVHLLWSDAGPGNLEIFHCWMDSGGGWSAPRRLTSNAGTSITPGVAVDAAGELHVVWQDNAFDGLPGSLEEGNSEIYYLHLLADGTPVAPPYRVSNSLGISQEPAVSLGSDGALHVVWGDNRDRWPGGINRFPFAIWYRRRLPGLGFGHEKRLYFTATDNGSPGVAAAPDGTVNVVWEDYATGNSELSYRQIRPDTGWDIERTRLTFTAGPSQFPCLLAGGGGVLDLVWSDAGTGEAQSVRCLSGRTDNVTPVVLGDIALVRDGDRLLLRWETVSEIEHAGFVVYAADEPDGESERLSSRLVTGGPRYELAIDPADLGGRGCLKLVSVSRSGHLEVAAVLPVAAAVSRRPVGVRLGPVYPNPSPGALRVPVECAGARNARLDLLDVQGRLVSRLDAGALPAGRSDIAWDLRGVGGAAPGAGRYWLRLLLDGKPAGRPAAVVVRR